MILYDKCPLTGSENIEKKIDVKDYTVSGESFSIWQNNDIKFRFTNPVPDENEIIDFYKSDKYISHSETHRGIINQLYLIARSWTVKRKRKLIESIYNKKNGYKLLDYGSGTGYFLNYMQKKSWECTGIEVDKISRNKSVERYGLNIKEPSSVFEFADNYFNVITLWHVLEHIHDLHGVMQELKRILAKNGKLVLALPNYSSYDASYYSKFWAAYDVPRHLYHFTPESVNYLFKKHGFKQEKLKLMPLDAFYVSMLSEKYRNGYLLNGLLTGILSLVKSILNTHSCSSVIYIASKM